MSWKNGVFVRSIENHDYDDIIDVCKDLIQEIKPERKINSAIKDRTYGGVRLYLDGDDAVQELLKKKILKNKYGHVLSTTHPLTTTLIVHNATFSMDKKDFIHHVVAKLQDTLGPVQEVQNISFSERHRDISSGAWRIVLNVPEIENLDAFKKVRLPGGFKIEVPGVDEMLSVKFYCTNCKEIGHTSWKCDKSLFKGWKMEKGVLTVDSPCKNPESLIEKKNDYQSNPISQHSNHRSLNANLCMNSFESFRKEDQKWESYPKKEFMSDAKRGNKIFETTPKVSSTIQPKNGASTISMFVNLVSFLAHQPANKSKSVKKVLIRSNSVVIPDRTKKFICEMKDKALDCKGLQAFLNHAKKRSNLSILAEAYGTNSEKLAEQLKKIKENYYFNYHISKEEEQFIKYLESVIDRLNR